MKRFYNYLGILLVSLWGSFNASAQSSTFTYSGSIISYTVPASVVSVNITAAGGQGGGQTINTVAGGNGAIMTGGFTVTPGQVLNILVGNTGVTAEYVGGGGGGSFVWDNATSTLMVAAGGGGGAGRDDVTASGITGLDATTANNGINGNTITSGGGIGGNGGTIPAGYAGYAGGGCGWFSNGNDGFAFLCTFPCTGGIAPLSGGAPGTGGGDIGTAADGGFGGGGGGNARCGADGGGGGGGYSGGGAGGELTLDLTYQAGGGGGSYNGGTVVSSSVGNTGTGYVIITNTCTTPVPGAIVGPSTACIGQTFTYTNPTGSPGGTWAITAGGASATIDPVSGALTGTAAGVVTIGWSLVLPCGSAATSTTITVNPTPAAMSGQDTVCAGGSISFTDPTLLGTWSSSVVAVGTIDPTLGTFTSIAAGMTIVSYTVNGCADTTHVTVNPYPAAIGGPAFVCTGSSVTLTNTLGGGTWSSSLPATGSITPAGGVLTGIISGTTTITYSALGCAVTTTESVNPQPSGIVSAQDTVCAGDSIAFTDPTTLGTWSSTVVAVGTIDPTLGSFTSIAAGTTTISYTVNGCASTALVTVNPYPAAIAGPAAVCQGSNITLTNTLGGGTWSSSFSATVGSITPLTGVLTGIAPGATTITYSVNGCAVTTIENVGLQPSPITGPDSVCVGSTTTLSSLPGGGGWSNAPAAAGTIDPASGIVTGIAAGTTVVTYNYSGCTVSATVTVNALPGPVSGPSFLCRYTTATFTDPTPLGTWSSAPAGLIATINPVTGVATPIIGGIAGSLGTALFTYTLPNGCSANSGGVNTVDTTQPITGPNIICQDSFRTLFDLSPGGTWSATPAAGVLLSVTGLSVDITGLTTGVYTITYSRTSCPDKVRVVSVAPEPAIITGPTAVCLGFTTNLADITPGGTWSSTNPSVFVSPTGAVTSGLTGLTDTIYYTLSTGCRQAVMVNVGNPPDGITTTADTICQGATAMFTPVTFGGVFSSTNLAIAQIDSSGLVRGISGGRVNISYTMPNGCYNTDSFQVNPPVTPSVTITGPPGPICAGSADTFVAHAVNAGAATYGWALFSTYPLPSTTDTLMAPFYIPIHGDVIMVYVGVHGVCSLVDTVVDTFAVDVYPDFVSPVITITTTPSDTISYIGETKTFFSSVTWGGSVTGYQWSVNGNAVPGATNSSFALQVYQNDTVSCQVTGNPPCPGFSSSSVSNRIFINSRSYLGVNNVDHPDNLLLFPNPNTGTFTLAGRVADGSKEVMYEVSNTLGQIVYRGTTMPQNGDINAQVSLSDVAEGSYLLRVTTGSATQTFHFVISR